jgi:hypothetical protein
LGKQERMKQNVINLEDARKMREQQRINETRKALLESAPWVSTWDIYVHDQAGLDQMTQLNL